jgi:hypothetical protein
VKSEEWDEVRYEQFLRESDARTERYGRLLEKYKDHPDSERIISSEMGWTWLEEALDWQEQEQKRCHEQREPEDSHAQIREEDEDPPPSDYGAASEFDEEIEDDELPPPDPMRDEIDWVLDDRGEFSHPIEKRAHDALHALLDELKAAGHFPEEEDDQLADFVNGYMTVSAKLAGALGGIARGEDFFRSSHGNRMAQTRSGDLEQNDRCR